MFSEIFKVIGNQRILASLLLSWIPPNLVSSALIFFYVLDELPADTESDVTEWLGNLGLTKVRAWLLVASLLSIGMYLLSRYLYRILEGYDWWPKCLKDRRISAHAMQLKRLNAFREAERYSEGHQPPDAGTSGKDPIFTLKSVEAYPVREDWLLPTKLGNVIRSFETYSYSVFGLDTQTFWYELLAVVPSYVREAVEDSRRVSDFFIAVYYSSFLLIAVNLLPLIMVRSLGPLVAIVGASIVAVWAYRGLLDSVHQWRYAIQALVHLGRAPLAAALRLKLPDTRREEYKMWEALTGAVQHPGQTRWWEILDDFRCDDPPDAHFKANIENSEENL